MWDRQEGTEAVFWTHLKGKLEQDMPAIAGYSHSVDRFAIGHIRSRHGDELSEKARGLLPVTKEDILKITSVVTQYDAIRTDLRSAENTPRVAYAKRFSDGVLLYLENVSAKRRNMRGVSMWKYPQTADVKKVLEQNLSPVPYAQDASGASPHVADDGILRQETQDTRCKL